MKRQTDGFAGGLGCITLVIVFVMLTFIPCAYAWDYAVSKWLVFYGKPDTFKFWHGLLISCVPGLGQMGLFAAAATFIAFLFL